MSKINENELKKAHKFLKDLENQFKKAIIQYLTQNGEKNVTDIYIPLGMDQTVASNHLTELKAMGVVKVRDANDSEDGRCQFYSINQDRISEINNATKKLNTPPEEDEKE